jgi:hypothetical protein
VPCQPQTVPNSGDQCNVDKHYVAFSTNKLPPTPTVSSLRRMKCTGKVYTFHCLGGGGARKILLTCPDRPWVPLSLLCSGYRLSFSGSKAAGAWRWPPTPSSAKVRARVELYLYFPSGPSWSVLEWIWSLPDPITAARFSFRYYCNGNYLHFRSLWRFFIFYCCLKLSYGIETYRHSQRSCWLRLPLVDLNL